MTKEEIRVIVKAIIMELGEYFQGSKLDSTSSTIGGSLAPCGEKVCEGLLLEDDVIALHKKGVRTLFISKNCIATPLALDKASDLKLTVRYEEVS